MERYGVIMAGGGGTRFWPLSRKACPKQLLNLTGKDQMINETLDRMGLCIAGKNLYVVTNVVQVPALKKAVGRRLLPEHILSEPSARNTAACIGYAAMEVLKKRGDGVLCVAPSDAYIRDWPRFAQVLEKAIEAAESGEKLVTIGIAPTFAATGYGYLRFEKGRDGEAARVLEFKEKPDAPTAEAYWKSGDYAWNSGMFIWKASTILESIRRFIPEVYEPLCRIGEAMGTPEEKAVLETVYPTIPKISIDYGVMEKSPDVWMVYGDFGWNDVGSWDMLGVLHEEDEKGNILLGDALAVDCEDSLLYSSGRLVSAVGVKDLVVVETPDAVMVCPKAQAQDVKKLVDALQEKGRAELL